MIQSVVVVAILVQLCFETTFATKHRTIFAWASGQDAAAVVQLKNATWSNLIDGVQVFCGVTFQPDGSGLLVNQTVWKQCSALRETTQRLGMKFHVVIAGKLYDESGDPQPVIDDAIKFAKKHNLDGFSLDDEYDCAPRSTLDRFEHWMKYVDEFARGLREAGLPLSAAVQAIFGIQDAPYYAPCVPPSDCSQACNHAPSYYPLEPRVPHLLSNSLVDKWLAMDTYYFSTGRFFNTLDWHVQHVPLKSLGVGIMNRNDLTDDGLVARFHAIDKSGVDWINIFLLPINDEFLPYLKRWKSHCAGCGVQSSLGCYDLDVPCRPEGNVAAKKSS